MQCSKGDQSQKTKESPRIAVTGATGFIGRQLLQDCAAAGVSVSALTRQKKVDEPGIRWVQGDLSMPEVLADLINGADCVVHLAGATKALCHEDFQKINTDATYQLAKLCVEANVNQFIFLSSLAATRPSVSPYAASKAAAESALSELRNDINIITIRAPAVLGPGDTATFPLFANLAKGFLPVPGGAARNARFSIMDVADLTALLLSLAHSDSDKADVITPYSHESLSWQDIADSTGRVLKRPIRQIVIPAAIMLVVARTTDLIAKLTGKAQVFSYDKLREMQAGDWIATSSVDHPVPLDDTLKRCLAPFLKQPNTAN